jgi:hypothetical protein
MARTRVKLMNEYTVAWPIWMSGGLADRGSLDLSDGLAARISEWARVFNDHFDPETGWDSSDLRARHATDAQALRRSLREELGDRYDVTLDLWER